MGQLVLKRAAASRLSGEWSGDDYEVLCEGAVVGRIMKAAAAAPVGQPWLWTLAYGHDEDRPPTHDVLFCEEHLHCQCVRLSLLANTGHVIAPLANRAQRPAILVRRGRSSFWERYLGRNNMVG